MPFVHFFKAVMWKRSDLWWDFVPVFWPSISKRSLLKVYFCIGQGIVIIRARSGVIIVKIRE